MKMVRTVMVALAALFLAVGLVAWLRPVEAAPISPHAQLAPGDILIHEVTYDTPQTGIDSAYEWIELYNATDQVLTLANWSIADANSSDVIPTIVISPDGFLVVAASTSFDLNYPTFTRTIVYLGGSIGNGLSNSGDRLTLRDNTGAIVDQLSYGSDTSVFNLPGVVAGHSLERQPIGVDTDTAADFVDRNPPTPGYGLNAPPAPAPSAGALLISAVHFDAHAGGDEGFRLTNVGTQALTLTNWIASDGESTLDLSGTLGAGQSLWIAKQAVTFTQQFGFQPDFEYETDSDPLVPNLAGSGVPLLGPDDELALREGASNWIDAVVWGTGQITSLGWTEGWVGSGVLRYSNNAIAARGQILYRKPDEASGAIVADTGTAQDWANDRADPVSGRRAMYPGWDLETLWQPAQIAATARLTVAIAPDNAFRVISDLLGSARESIKMEMHTFEHAALVGVLTRTMQTHNVSVTILLEGGPVGGIDDQERWVCQHIDLAGGECWFMINDSGADIRDRYDYLHAKLIIIDDRSVAIGSENLSPASLPDDDFADGTLGRRGAYLVTDAPGVVTRALLIWNADFDPTHHADLFPWTSGHPTYGAPPLGFTPVFTTGGSGYSVRYPQPLSVAGPLTFELFTAPESSLRASDALLGLIAQAGPGDAIDAEQLDEPPHWGNSTSNAIDDPNLRLEALIQAASRGAHVRLLLDGFFDDATSPTSNEATRVYVDSLRATSPTLMSNLEVRRGNPALGGIHNKMFLFQIGGRKIAHVGSLNGTETSNKVNREVVLQVESSAAYDYLHAMFEVDWAFQPRVYLPLLAKQYQGPANHLLVSKVFYLGTPGVDEWIQIYNPTPITISLGTHKIGDEETAGGGGFGFDGMWQFPAAATIAPGQKIDIAGTFAGFYNRFGYDPDFAFFDGVAGVNRLSPYLAWTSAVTFTLANAGDEVLLLGPGDAVVDGVAWGTGSLAGNVPCPAIAPPPYASIERTPIGQDTDSCPADFVTNPSPLP